MFIIFDFMWNLNPIIQALLATIFTWAMTALGAAFVFAKKELSKKWLDSMLGFAAGVMIAASYWSLLAPAIEMSKGQKLPVWLPVTLGFLLGGIFLRGIDRILPHLHLGFPIDEAEGIKTSWQRSTLLVLAITLHNIPEGMAVGVAFGALAHGSSSVTFSGALALTIGLGFQNLPEGVAVSLPLYREGLSRVKSFWYGQLSGVVEPMAGVIGAAMVGAAESLLPYALAFAAGAMIFVVIEEVIPESQRSGHADLATMGAMTGFVLMMILDIAFS
jgi:ZIP family zinc transporter